MPIDFPASNLAQWISTYPKSRNFFVHPKNIRRFMAAPPPIVGERVPDRQWKQIVRQILER